MMDGSPLAQLIEHATAARQAVQLSRQTAAAVAAAAAATPPKAPADQGGK